MCNSSVNVSMVSFLDKSSALRDFNKVELVWRLDSRMEILDWRWVICSLWRLCCVRRVWSWRCSSVLFSSGCSDSGCDVGEEGDDDM